MITVCAAILTVVSFVFAARALAMKVLEKLDRAKALANRISEELSRPRKLVIFASCPRMLLLYADLCYNSVRS